MKPGDHISHYTILEKLGEGGMGVVYKARDTKLDRDVALKFLHTGPDGSDEEHQRFLNEARAAAKLSHTNICNIYSIREHEGQPFIEMEFIEGETLRDKLPGITGDLTAAVNLAVQIAAGLSAAHKKGIVHRDIKPENIMVTGEGQVKIMDFGLARLQGIGSMTREGSTVGTMAYMSPEQIRSEEIDHRSDQFSFGMMLFEMLTGKRAFRGEHEAALMYSIVNEEPDTGILEQTGVPEPMTGILTRCLQKEPEQRYNKTEELLNDLQSFARSSSKVQELSFGSGTTGASGSARIKMAAAAVIILAVAIGGYLYFTNDSTVNENLVPNRVAVVVFENQTGDPSLDPIGRMAADWLIQGLARTKIVDIVSSEVSLATYEPDRTLQHNISSISEFTKANIIVVGTYYSQGSQIIINPRIYDAYKEELLVSLDPIEGISENPMEAIEVLQQKVLGALATVFDDRLKPFADLATKPPLYEAYEEYMKGQELFYTQKNYSLAIQHYQKAFDLDSTFISPLFVMAVVYLNLDNYSKADSLSELLSRKYYDLLIPSDRHMSDWLSAYIKGDFHGAITANRLAAKTAPGSVYHYNLGLVANRMNRPNETIEAYQSLNPASPMLQGWWNYWGVLCSAHHMIGDHAGELRCAQDARRQYPDVIQVLLLEVRAHSVLGNESEVLRLLEESKRLQQTDGWQAYLKLTAAREFRVHGFNEHSEMLYGLLRQYFEETYSRLPDNDADLHYLGDLYFDTGQPGMAADIFRQMSNADPDNISWLGHLGVTLVKAGSREEALDVYSRLESIERKYVNGANYLWMAAIRAQLGELDEAEELLKEGHRRGMPYGVYLHIFLELEPLYGHPGFIEFMRPKG